MSLEFKNNESCGAGASEIDVHAKKLDEYVTELQNIAGPTHYETPDSCINLPFDEDLYREVKNVFDYVVTGDLNHIVLIGIGGSNLGVKAIYDALYGEVDIVTEDRVPKMYFCDTVDSLYMTTLAKYLRDKVRKPEEVLFIIVSKSGSTIETISNAEYLIHTIGTLFGAIDERILVISDKATPLSKYAEKRGGNFLTIPEKISGRFSVFSAVGIFPLMCIDQELPAKIISGARKMRNKCLIRGVVENPALLSAAIVYENYAKGKNIHNFFVFQPEFESLGKWHRQLLGESLGKNGMGIFPAVSVGSTDLHSVAQLYLGGPRNIFTSFMRVEQPKYKSAVIAPATRYGDTSGYLAGYSLDNVMGAFYDATVATYKENDLPYTEILLSEPSGELIGEYLQLKMMETMFLAKLMGVNAFDQPNVELYKNKTRDILRKK
jgi:glucose-6-phosphate isomerase